MKEKWLMLTTIPGLEETAQDEAIEKIHPSKYKIRPENIKGRLSIKISEKHLEKTLRLRSIEYIILLLKTFRVDNTRKALETIYQNMYNTSLQQLGPSFRITCERIGKHQYTSIDVQKTAGQAVVDRYGTKVVLEKPDTIIRVDVIHNTCIIGTLLNHQPLHIRYKRIFHHPSALNPIIAYAMLRSTKIQPQDKILDAFCGGGTILIEALQNWENIETVGLDINEKYIKGATLNADMAHINKKNLRLIVGNACKLEKSLPSEWKPNKVISNLPFGIRSGRKKTIPNIYKDFLTSLKTVLAPENKICLLTTHNRLLKNIADQLGYNIIKEQQILYGGLTCWIIQLTLLR